MKRKLNFILVGSSWLLAACVLALLSPHWTTVTPSQALVQATPEMTPRAYLPHIAKDDRPPVTPPPPGNWLSYVNYHRALADLPPVAENSTWSDGCWKHARYMVKNDYIGHSEEPDNPWYTPEGLAAAQSSNAMVSYSVSTSDEYAIDLWMKGPFHAVGIIDPALLQTGYGSYREADGGYQMGAALDVIRGLGNIPSSIEFPIQWPAGGMTVLLREYPGSEHPDPLTSCPGYRAPSGLPIVLQIGPGNITPTVTDHSFMQGSTPLDHCVYDEISYTNPDGSDQSLGRGILNARDAIVLIPREPLTPGASYTASITVNGQAHTWSFTVSSAAQAVERAPETLIR